MFGDAAQILGAVQRRSPGARRTGLHRISRQSLLPGPGRHPRGRRLPAPGSAAHGDAPSGIASAACCTDRRRRGPRLLRALANRLYPPTVQLRPRKGNIKELCALVRRARVEERAYVEFMLHSSEFMPGGSPTFRTERDVDRLFDDLHELFDTARQAGFCGARCGVRRSLLPKWCGAGRHRQGAAHMKLVEALRSRSKRRRPMRRPCRCCSPVGSRRCTCRHFSAAFLKRHSPDQAVAVQTGLFGDCLRHRRASRELPLEAVAAVARVGRSRSATGSAVAGRVARPAICPTSWRRRPSAVRDWPTPLKRRRHGSRLRCACRLCRCLRPISCRAGAAAASPSICGRRSRLWLPG